jgi:SAM-dependent methyltransferase
MNSNQLLLKLLKQKPQLYEPSSSKFWDDEHISKGMLEAHLNPEWDAATRNYDFVQSSVNWITEIADPIQFPKLLDLGCGPGIYAELFHQKGFQVTGVDFSSRSIQYATESAMKNQRDITYHYMNYLELPFVNEFDVVTLIYCDFGVLSDLDRSKLLDKIYRALKPGGKLIFDVFTPQQYKNKAEENSFSYEEPGFWNDKPHICLNSLYRYEENNTYLNQTIVITEDKLECYNIWEHTFLPEELINDIYHAGFADVDFYGDIAGMTYTPDSTMICVVSHK